MRIRIEGEEGRKRAKVKGEESATELGERVRLKGTGEEERGWWRKNRWPSRLFGGRGQ